jgi:hypothetical protein
MKWFSRAAVGGLLWLTFGGAAFGSTLYITAFTQNVDDGGQFLANLGNPAQSFYIYCVDFQNDETTPSQVNISTPNTSTPDLTPNYDGLANTRYGAVPTALFTYDGTGPTAINSAERYVLAAWLTTQFDFSSGVTSADDQIQNAIWTLLNTTGTTTGFPYGDAAGTGTYLSQAINFFDTTPTAKLLQFESEVRVFTSTDVVTYNGPDWSPVSGTQEMIAVIPSTSTPEPATIAMMGAGMLQLVWFRKRMKA